MCRKLFSKYTWDLHLWKGRDRDVPGQKEKVGSNAVLMKSSGPSELFQVAVRRPMRTSQWSQLLAEQV